MTIKGIAIILMLIHHLFSCSPEFVERFNVSTFFIPLGSLMSFSAFSNFCVSLFVFVSGYGIAVSMMRSSESISHQAARRFIKLEKGVIIVYLISIATCFLRPDRLSVYFQGGKISGLAYMIIDALGLSTLFATPMYNETWWYLSVAIVVIFAAPILTVAWEKFGVCVLGIAAALPILGLAMGPFTQYLLTLVLGIGTARSGLLNRLADLCAVKKKKYAFILIDIVLILAFLYAGVKLEYRFWVNDILCLLIALLLFAAFDLRNKKLRVLPFLGKYSMNMFLIHTLIFEYYFTDFIYMGRNWLLITVVLAVISLVISIIIELLKKQLDKVLPAALRFR